MSESVMKSPECTAAAFSIVHNIWTSIFSEYGKHTSIPRRN